MGRHSDVGYPVGVGRHYITADDAVGSSHSRPDATRCMHLAHYSTVPVPTLGQRDGRLLMRLKLTRSEPRISTIE